MVLLPSNCMVFFLVFFLVIDSLVLVIHGASLNE